MQQKFKIFLKLVQTVLTKWRKKISQRVLRQWSARKKHRSFICLFEISSKAQKLMSNFLSIFVISILIIQNIINIIGVNPIINYSTIVNI